jgi:serine/threonine protein kinase
MNFPDLVGQTLDEKYRIESQLGRGGMGTVYLATHLGTERPVAVKIISPQYMKRPEFVERFRREARAAGRLRHPNVVDVTDFGFADTSDGQVAYLVMEYLDGCTLGEILEEEKNLPVAWTLDILEQVCSAVHEAHQQGIIHRDLKPDNIWLEPNQRGGYTVKVLDFGIAKLETQSDSEIQSIEPSVATLPTHISPGQVTVLDHLHGQTIHDSISPTLIGEPAAVATVYESIGSESNTLIQPTSNDAPASTADPDTVGTKLIEDSASRSAGLYSSTTDGSDLTRVGSVLGTPLYMSPEQCRGERLDARSDIYSLGVIAYQMLSGATPFTGEFTEVMAAHRELPPPPLENKKVRKKLKRVIHAAMAKNADDRPQTADALASVLRSRSEGIWALLRRAGMIYTEHMPKFLMLSAFFFLPTILLTFTLIVLSFLRASDAISTNVSSFLIGINTVVLGVVSGFCAYLIIGTITWIVTQTLAVPLRPIKLRASLKEAKKKWKTFAGTGLMSTALTLLALPLTCGIGFVVLSVLWMLVAPVVMMENLRGRQALKRSKDLVKRSVATSAAAFCIMFLLPAISAGVISFLVNVSAKAFSVQHSELKALSDTIRQKDSNAAAPPEEPKEQPPAVETPAVEKKDDEININFGNNRAFKIDNSGKDMRSRLKDTVLETLLQIFLLPIQIVVTSFTAIIVALLYLKTRQAGGEPLQELLAQFEETEYPRKKWQERVRQRLIQSGRITSRS